MRDDKDEVQGAFLLSEVASGRHFPYGKGLVPRAIPPVEELEKYEREKQKRFEEFKKDWYLHKRDEERRNLAEIKENHALLKRLWTDLYRGRTQPRPVTHRQLNAEESWIQRVKEYFHLLKRRVGRDEFERWVDQFAFAQCDSFQDGSTVLLDPQHISGMPDLSTFTPRTGGPRPSADIQDRNKLIRKYRTEARRKRKKPISTYICRKLDEHRIPTVWPTEFQSWMKRLSKDSKSHQKFIHGIKVLMAKNYIDNLSEEVKKGHLEKAQQGQLPSLAPIGYRNNTQDHTI